MRSAVVDRPAASAGPAQRGCAGPARRSRWSAGGMLIAVDALAVIAAILIERTLPSSVGHVPLGWSVGYACAVVAGLLSRGLYGWRQRRGGLDLIGTIVAVTAVAAMATLSLRTAFGAEPDAASRVVRLWLFTATYLMSAHIGGVLALRRLRAGEVIGSRTLIVGAGEVGQTIARRLQAMPSLGLMPIGFADDEPLEGDDYLALPRLGGFDDLTEILEVHSVDCVIVAFPNRRDHEIAGSVRALARRGVEVLIVPRLFEDLTTRVHIERLGGYALLSQRHARPGGVAIACKYAIERLVAAVALIILSPLLLTIAIAVRRSGPGPVLFRQPRVGLDGHEFELLKFRTMRGDPEVDGHADTHWLAEALGAEAGAPGPDRSTPVGIRLRRWSLDELPQLLNIVRGDMALIGPRPERVAYARLLSERIYRYGDRHRVRSGLTGWAQIKDLRGESSLPDRVAWDNDYIENWSFWLDLKILLLTLPAVWRHARAKATSGDGSPRLSGRARPS